MELPGNSDEPFDADAWRAFEDDLAGHTPDVNDADSGIINDAVSESLTQPDDLPEDEFVLPDPSALADAFSAMEAFNSAEDASMRFGSAVVDGLIKQNHKEKYIAEGMTEDEAIAFIKANEGERSEAEESVALDHEMIAVSNEDTLRSFGLVLDQDLFEEAHAEVIDGTRFVAGLSLIAENNTPPEVQRGLNSILHNFNAPLWGTVISNHGEEIDALGARPFWMHSGYHPEPENHTRMVETLTHGAAIADECERLGADEKEIAELRDTSRYYNENMIVEWSVAKEMGFFDSPFGEEGMQSLYRQDYGWDSFWKMMDQAESKSMPGDTFVADARDRATEHMSAYLRTVLGSNLRSVTTEVDAERWPDRAAAEEEIMVAAAQDEYVAGLVAVRTRLQRYGHKYDAQA